MRDICKNCGDIITRGDGRTDEKGWWHLHTGSDKCTSLKAVPAKQIAFIKKERKPFENKSR